MKTTIFNFLVVQVVVWSIVFSGKISDKGGEVNYAVISDTWEVVNVGETSDEDIAVNYPEFNKLTDGSY